MDEIIKQSIEELIAERDRLQAELDAMKKAAFFEQSVSKTIYDRMKYAHEMVCIDNTKLRNAVDIQAERIAELTRQLAELRKTLGGEE